MGSVRAVIGLQRAAPCVLAAQGQTCFFMSFENAHTMRCILRYLRGLTLDE